MGEVFDRAHQATTLAQRCRETVSQGKTSSGQGCQADRSTLRPSSLPSVEVIMGTLPSVKGWKCCLLTCLPSEGKNKTVHLNRSACLVLILVHRLSCIGLGWVGLGWVGLGWVESFLLPTDAHTLDDSYKHPRARVHSDSCIACFEVLYRR